MAKEGIKIYGRLVSGTTEEVLAHADEILVEEATASTPKKTVKDALDGTAALDKHVQMLDMSQWPRNVIKSITPGLSNIEGEVYLAPQFSDMDPVTLSVLTKGVRYDIGEPSQHTVYTTRDTKKSYLWDGSKFTEIAGGESSEGTNVYVSGNTLVLGGKSGGDGGN